MGLLDAEFDAALVALGDLELPAPCTRFLVLEAGVDSAGTVWGARARDVTMGAPALLTSPGRRCCGYSTRGTAPNASVAFVATGGSVSSTSATTLTSSARSPSP